MSVVLKMASEVSNFLMDMDRKRHAQGFKTPKGVPSDDLAYGEALVDWYLNNRAPSNAYFSTEDEFLLFYKSELCLRFGLEVVTWQEGKLRRLREATKVIPVCGDGEGIGFPVLDIVLTPTAREKKLYGKN